MALWELRPGGMQPPVYAVPHAITPLLEEVNDVPLPQTPSPPASILLSLYRTLPGRDNPAWLACKGGILVIVGRDNPASSKPALRTVGRDNPSSLTDGHGRPGRRAGQTALLVDGLERGRVRAGQPALTLASGDVAYVGRDNPASFGAPFARIDKNP